MYNVGGKLLEYCRIREKVYFDLVERLQPDYLFIIQRFVGSVS